MRAQERSFLDLAVFNYVFNSDAEETMKLLLRILAVTQMMAVVKRGRERNQEDDVVKLPIGHVRTSRSLHPSPFPRKDQLF